MWHSLDKLELAEHFLAMRHCEVIMVTAIRHRTYIFFRVCVLDVGGSRKQNRGLQVLAYNKKSRVVFRTRHLQMRCGGTYICNEVEIDGCNSSRQFPRSVVCS